MRDRLKHNPTPIVRVHPDLLPDQDPLGLAFRDYDECVKYIRESNSLKVPEGGVALPLAYASAPASPATPSLEAHYRVPKTFHAIPVVECLAIRQLFCGLHHRDCRT